MGNLDTYYLFCRVVLTICRREFQYECFTSYQIYQEISPRLVLGENNMQEQIS